MSKEKMCAGGPCKDADIYIPSDYNHPKATGGAGGSPCKFRKREGTLDDKRIITGKHCQANFD
jgi:hypothetical protein